MRNQLEQFEKKFIQVILADLYERPFKWSVEKPEGRFTRPDMVLNIDHEGYNKWYLEFRPCISRASTFHLSQILFISMVELQ